MQIHHAKHHAAYVANLNLAEEKISVAKNDLAATIHLQQMHKFNGGGHINHSIFWTNLAPPTGLSILTNPCRTGTAGKVASCHRQGVWDF
jgi:superoxide dismutase